MNARRDRQHSIPSNIREPVVVHNQPNKLISCSFMNSKIADSINFIPVHRLARSAVSIISYLTCLAESSPPPFLSLFFHRERRLHVGISVVRSIHLSISPFRLVYRAPCASLTCKFAELFFSLSLSLSLGQQTSIEPRNSG